MSTSSDSKNPTSNEEIGSIQGQPPIYLALDLWMALGLPTDQFDDYYERNHWANTWANLLAAVRQRTGRKVCWKPVGQGERCVLTDRHFGPCYGDSDVGISEPLPFSSG
jgi:hypothetical protein